MSEIRKATLVIAALLTAGCASTVRIPSSSDAGVYTGEYRGPGLYLGAIPLTATNAVNDFAFEIIVANGFPSPVFVNVEPDVVFVAVLEPHFTWLDNAMNVITKGTVGVHFGVGRAHPETYMFIPGGFQEDGKLVRTCCNTTGISYHEPLDLSYFQPDEGFPWPVPEETARRADDLRVTMPVHIEYFILGDQTRRTCDTNVTLRITAGAQGQSTLSPLPYSPATEKQ